ncbi:MAG: DUF1631 family protein [Pseudomonadota bacterium]
MSVPDPRLHAAMQSAVQRILSTVADTASRTVDVLGMLALSAKSNADRQAYMAAQYDFQHKLSAFNMTFTSVLNEKVAQQLHPRSTRPMAATDWTALGLVGDQEVEEQVTAHRLGLAIEHECEWELRELDAYMGSLLGLGRPDPERNPIRPEIVGKALFRAIESVTTDVGVRKTLARELAHGLAKSMRQCYGAIVADLSARGVQPVGLAVRSGITGTGGVTAPASAAPRTTPPDLHRTAQTLSALFGVPPPSSFATSAGGLFGPSGGSAFAASGEGSHRSGFGAAAPGPTGSGAAGRVSDAQMAELIRRLAFLASTPGALDPAAASGWTPGMATGGVGGGVPPSGEALSSGLGGLMAVNLIRAHREELVRAASAPLDHMVIDIVASLFDQILSDPKVPPQMARQIARLQLPVLRVALKDVRFFSSRSHPVRKFVNRMASIACAFEDFDDGPGMRFLSLVRELVQQIVEGDFDQMDLYESKLRALEGFVQEQAQDEARAHAEAVELLAQKESQLRLQARYAEQVQAVLLPLGVQDFVREFLQQTWSQVQVEAAMRHGPDAEITRRMKQAARELILSVQPKHSPAERKQFILTLPQLMKTLHEGLALIRWPEDKKKAFFSELLPCHAQSLKGQPLSDSQRHQLESHLQALDRLELPKAEDTPPPDAAPVLQGEPTGFSDEEAAQVGLVQEAAVDWDGQVDIDLAHLDDGAAGGDVDINLDGLGAELRPETPTQGAQLAQYVQAGVAYQMFVDGAWKKVRLNWVSPGRTFFIFSQGHKHQKIISMTGRMLAKLCESGRFRAFEQAYLIERAVARARRQLAALTAHSRS